MKTLPSHANPRFLLILWLPFLLILLPACGQEIAEPPHILFAIADDWGWPHAGAYDDPVVQTPAFDRVAAEGILFNHAYVSAPSCTPSRNAILTGQYHWRLGPGANLWSTLDPSIPVYPHLLEDAGYKTGFLSKSWGPGDISNWERHPAGKEYPEKGGFDQFMEEWDGKQPFCFFLGSHDPHRGYEKGSGKASGMDLENIRLFECFPDHPEVRSDVADYYYEVQRFDTVVGRALATLEAYGVLENTIVVVCGDNGMPFPRCKANNYDSGVRIPLAIRWGNGIADPGQAMDDFISTTDLAPTFLEAAGVKVPGVMTGQSMTGLFSRKAKGKTYTENRSWVLHGKERHVPGQEDNLGGYPVRAIRTHDFLYIRNFLPERWPSGTPNHQKAFRPRPNAWLADCDNGPTKSHMVENRDLDAEHRQLYALAFGKRPAEELYDCRNDPAQLINLAGRPEYAEVQARLSGLLMEKLRKTGDPRVAGPPFDFDAVPYVPYLRSGPRHPAH